MRRVLMLSLLIAACSAAVFSQERSKFEAAVGFSISSIDTGQQDSGFINAGNRETGYAFDTSLTGYLTRNDVMFNVGIVFK